MLQVSVSTIQRRRREFGLSDEFERYSDITDDELDQIHASVTGNSCEGPLSPLTWEGGDLLVHWEAVVNECLTSFWPCWHCFAVENDNPSQKIFWSNLYQPLAYRLWARTNTIQIDHSCLYWWQDQIDGFCFLLQQQGRYSPLFVPKWSGKVRTTVTC